MSRLELMIELRRANSGSKDQSNEEEGLNLTTRGEQYSETIMRLRYERVRSLIPHSSMFIHQEICSYRHLGGVLITGCHSA